MMYTPYESMMSWMWPMGQDGRSFCWPSLCLPRARSC